MTRDKWTEADILLVREIMQAGQPGPMHGVPGRLIDGAVERGLMRATRWNCWTWTPRGKVVAEQVVL